MIRTSLSSVAFMIHFLILVRSYLGTSLHEFDSFFFGELFHLTQLKDFLTAWSFFRKPRDNVFTIIQSFANVYSGIECYLLSCSFSFLKFLIMQLYLPLKQSLKTKHSWLTNADFLDPREGTLALFALSVPKGHCRCKANSSS